ncbi:MAG: PIG-L family deacetylase [Bacilli bacterium]|nr:PIG-L family deacetylase [Bacilli bacterium]
MKLKKIFFIILLLSLPMRVNAKDISKEVKITINDNITSIYNDGNETTKKTISRNDIIKVTTSNTINGIYIIYDTASMIGSISSDDKTIAVGENKFLHEYINLEDLETNEITITYSNNVTIKEIYTFDNNSLPKWVQQWHLLDKDADLLLFSTHADDEHLFFAGLLPTYVAKGYDVQVVYLTNHNDNPTRLHEQLNGLWEVGVTNYPVIGFVPDAYSTTLKSALKNLKRSGYTEDSIVDFYVELLRKYKPLIVFGHDEKGEYSHGQHILNTYVLKKALELTNNKDYYIDSFNNYGLWDVPATYLHLYQENQITMDYDTPLAMFNNLTAYEISKNGYSKHLSQQYTWFTDWLRGKKSSYTSASQITKYSPLKFGLYRSIDNNDIKTVDDLVIERDENKNEEEAKKQYIIINEIDAKHSLGFAITTWVILIAITILLIINKRRH